jgi:hypothetical protein
MKKWSVIVCIAMLLFGIVGVSGIPFFGPDAAFACGCAFSSGDPGGGDYGPQSQGPSGSYFDRPALTEQQAHDVIEQAVKRWRTDLEVGEITDSGDFYEAKILTAEKKIFSRLAVDKKTGQISVIY